MGLPQVPLDDSSEEGQEASVDVFLQSPPQFLGASTCGLDCMRGGSFSQTIGGSLCSSLGDFQRKTSLELSEVSQNSFKLGGKMNVHPVANDTESSPLLVRKRLLSPLNSVLSQFSERIAIDEGCRNLTKDISDSHSSLKNIEQSVDRFDTGVIFVSDEEEFEISSRSFDVIDYSHEEFCPSSLENAAGLRWPLPQEPAPTSHCRRSIKRLEWTSY
ncbi:hypothetical protein Gorai_022004 [Gossypium raimondii]|uniref:Uncharacterized protein n=1 Tax=Gossypium raimondii TaxID=29730 RepID=A0A7J8NS36_GOSRA|nr:hypothetical protein [Gossypium raimondii]